MYNWVNRVIIITPTIPKKGGNQRVECSDHRPGRFLQKYKAFWELIQKFFYVNNLLLGGISMFRRCILLRPYLRSDFRYFITITSPTPILYPPFSVFRRRFDFILICTDNQLPPCPQAARSDGLITYRSSKSPEFLFSWFRTNIGSYSFLFSRRKVLKKNKRLF